MKTSFFFFLFFFCGFSLLAQTRNPALDINRANIWHFGHESMSGAKDAPSLHFENGSPYVLNDGNPAGGLTPSTICDSIGNLQLYSGYFKLFNSVHSAVLNSGFVGDSGVINILQGNLAIPKPNEPNIVYYFSASVTLRYNVVDMSLDNGRGAVIERNVILHPYPVEAKLAAVHHCNGRDVWVVGHIWNTNKFYAYLVTESGIDTVPVISQTGTISGEQGMWQAGSVKFSPNGKKIAIAFGGTTKSPCVFDFDNSTGVISNPIVLTASDESEWGLSFSPNNQVLYVSTNDNLILQYNLNAGDSTDIVASRKLIYDAAVHNMIRAFGRMQIGRDGKIYVIQMGSPGADYLGVINNPNALDTLCDFDVHGLYLQGSFGDGGFNTIESYYYTGTSAYPCYGDTTTINCNDNNVCTVDSLYPFAGCVYTSINCDDADSCTIDACDSVTGCFHTPIVNCIDGLSAIEGKIYVRAIPNPFADKALIEISSAQPITRKAEYRLLDALSKEVAIQLSEISRSPNEIKAILHRGKLNPGLYFLTVKAADNTATIKISIF